MDFFYIIGIGEAAQGRLLAFGFGICDHGRIHGFKLESFSGDGLFKVVGSAADPFQSSQMRMGVDSFRRRGGLVVALESTQRLHLLVADAALPRQPLQHLAEREADLAQVPATVTAVLAGAHVPEQRRRLQRRQPPVRLRGRERLPLRLDERERRVAQEEAHAEGAVGRAEHDGVALHVLDHPPGELEGSALLVGRLHVGHDLRAGELADRLRGALPELSADGREVQVASRKADSEYPHQGWTERSMDALWQGTAEVVNCNYRLDQFVPDDVNPYEYDPEQAKALLDEAVEMVEEQASWAREWPAGRRLRRSPVRSATSRGASRGECPG